MKTAYQKLLGRFLFIFFGEILDAVKISDEMLNKHTKILTGYDFETEVENSILENKIYGVDINDESVEIAKFSLWLRTAQKGRKLNSLSNNIKFENSLIDDPEVDGEKTFTWQTEFPEVLKNGGFDVRIGNPPYVRAERLVQFIDYFRNRCKVFDPASDLFAYFYE